MSVVLQCVANKKTSWFKNNICASWNKQASKQIWIWIVSGIATNKCVHFVVVVGCAQYSIPLLLFAQFLFFFCFFSCAGGDDYVMELKFAFFGDMSHRSQSRTTNNPLRKSHRHFSEFFTSNEIIWAALKSRVWCWSANWCWCELCVCLCGQWDNWACVCSVYMKICSYVWFFRLSSSLSLSLSPCVWVSACVGVFVSKLWCDDRFSYFFELYFSSFLFLLFSFFHFISFLIYFHFFLFFFFYL